MGFVSLLLQKTKPMKKIYASVFVLLLCFLTKVNAQCTVSFTFTTNGLTINATATGVGVANIPVYGFDWGDAQQSVGQTASHTYAAGGTYLVCAAYFDLADTAACSATSCQAVTFTTGTTELPATNALSMSTAPNPFTGKTVVSLGASVAQNNVSVEVYDMVGKKVTTLYNDQLAAGIHFIEWNAEGFDNGVYFVRVQNGDQVIVQRVIKQ